MKRGKKYVEAAKAVDRANLYETEESKNEFGKKTQPDRMGIFNSGCTSYLYLLLLSYDTGNYPVLYQKRIRICRAGKLPENIKG